MSHCKEYGGGLPASFPLSLPQHQLLLLCLSATNIASLSPLGFHILVAIRRGSRGAQEPLL